MDYFNYNHYLLAGVIQCWCKFPIKFLSEVIANKTNCLANCTFPILRMIHVVEKDAANLSTPSGPGVNTSVSCSDLF